ncbi:alpha-ketoglutarate dependent xanthine dioxygenase [Acephala macrosclerotiorum]|nr:alpha-ketoglutarate dependent xanthine dioxygenase [Acephala macrosclerotiorum]
MPSATLPTSPLFTIQPLSPYLRKDTLIGAEVLLNNHTGPIDPSSFTPEDVSILRQALYDNSVLVIKKQMGINPLALEKLASIWDPDMINVHSAGKDQVRDPRSILSRNNGARLPAAPNVQVIGNGEFKNYERIERMDLRHVDSAEFHAQPLTEEELKDGQTRFYRWHQDAPLYENLPGKVTLIHAVVVPKLPDQKIKFEDGREMTLQAGSTAFISGAKAFQLLTPSEQEFALNTIVQYAPRAYEWIRNAKATSDGLGIAKVGDEAKEEDLPAWSWDKVQAFPMAWQNLGRPEQPHLQILGCCVHSLRTTDLQTGEVTTISDLVETRRICYEMQRKVVKPEHVYAHHWEEGDLVIFHNYGVWHSITGQLGKTQRLMWQVTMRSGKEPEPARAIPVKV